MINKAWLESVVLNNSSGAILLAIVALKFEKKHGPFILLDEALVLKAMVFHQFYAPDGALPDDIYDMAAREFSEEIYSGILEAFEFQNFKDSPEGRFFEAFARTYEMLWSFLMLLRTDDKKSAERFAAMVQDHYGRVMELTSEKKNIEVRILLEPFLPDITEFLAMKNGPAN